MIEWTWIAHAVFWSWEADSDDPFMESSVDILYGLEVWAPHRGELPSAGYAGYFNLPKYWIADVWLHAD